MPHITAKFEIWCGICGTGVCQDTEVYDDEVTVACHHCKQTIEELESDKEDLEYKIEELERRIKELEADGKNM